jgi:hypothetical protein
MSIDSMPMDSISIVFGREGSPGASMSVGRPSQQISIKNGRPLAGMKPGGMSPRDASATSMMLAMSARLFQLPRLKRISQGAVLGGKNINSKSDTA